MREHVGQREVIGVARVGEDQLERGVVSAGQHQERFEHGRHAMAMKALNGKLERGDDVVADLLWIAAGVGISRSGQLVVQVLGELEERVSGERTVGVGLVFAGVDQRGEQFVFVELERQVAAVLADLMIGGQHGVAQRKGHGAAVVA